MSDDIYTDLREVRERLRAVEGWVLEDPGPTPILAELRKTLSVLDEWVEE